MCSISLVFFYKYGKIRSKDKLFWEAKRMKFLKANWPSLLTILLLLTIGILLLVNPQFFSMLIVRVIGGLLIAGGGYYIFRYFRQTPEEAAKSQLFFNGSVFLAVGLFCLLASGWLLRAFPILAVIFGLLQILLGFYMVQKTVDDLRTKQPLWYLKAISAGISLVFGFIIASNPDMAFMDIWVFTGIALILEAVFDAFAMIFSWKKANARPAVHVTVPGTPQQAEPSVLTEGPASSADASAGAGESPASGAQEMPADAPIASWAMPESAPAQESAETPAADLSSPES